MQKSESVANLVKSLIAAKKKFMPILKDKENPYFKSKYADLAAAIESTEPALLENGLVVSQFPQNDGERVGVLTMLLHETGEFLQDVFTLPVAKNDAQTGTAAVTYARRSAYQAILGVAAEDDDGNKAAGNAAFETKSTSASKTASAKPAVATKAAQAPKAEIPKELPSAQPKEESVPLKTETHTAGSSDIPTEDRPITEDELKGIRSNLKLLADDLSSAGLKARRGLPINRLILAYILKVTGKEGTEKITRNGWTQFQNGVSTIKASSGGVKALVAEVNAATPIKEEKAQ